MSNVNIKCDRHRLVGKGQVTVKSPRSKILRAESTKFIDVGINFHDPWFRQKFFFQFDTKAQATKQNKKIRHMTAKLSELQRQLSLSALMESQPTEGKDICQSYLIRDFYVDYIKNCLNSMKRQANFKVR